MPKPLANILEKRGYFWWQGEPISDDRFAPATAIPGLLEIDSNGLATLKLDGSLLQTEYPNGLPFNLDQIILEGRSIAGRITEDRRQQVSLRNIEMVGNILSNTTGTSEEYSATTCLIGATPTHQDLGQLNFRKMSISLKGMEEWVFSNSIESTLMDGDGVNYIHEVKYTVTPNRYEIDNGTIVLRSDVRYPIYFRPSLPKFKSRQISFEQEEWLDYSPSESATPKEMIEMFGRIEEFLAILTGSYYCLDWPQLIFGEGNDAIPCVLYFWRNVDKSSPPEMRNLWTIFPQVRDRFGALFSSWKKKRVEYGPGFYLYLGTLRSSTMYVEHRFVNLIWGLESFHRKRPPKSGKHAKTKRRLGDRIFEVFNSLPLGMEENALRGFAAKCANRRDEVSHFGGSQHGEDYGGFIQDIMRLTNAASYLYHAALLHEIGLDDETLRTCFNKSVLSFAIRRALQEVGLQISEENKGTL
jgi:hypothetical protein